MIGGGYLNVSHLPGSCPVGGQIICYSSAVTTSGAAGNITLNGPIYVGDVPQFTPYIRSQVTSVEGFRGCLGVSGNVNKLLIV